MVDREFLFVRPYCVQALEDPSPENVRALQNALSDMNQVCLQQLQEYVMVPLTKILTSPNKSEALIVSTLDCICTLVTATEIRSWTTFSKTTFFLVMTISSQEKSETEPVAKISDEIKQAVLVCLKSLVDHSAHNVLENFYSSNFLTQMGHLVFLLVNVAEKDAARDTRVLAMECLTVMCKQHDSRLLRKQAGDSLATFLPGLSMGLTKIAVDGGIAGWAVIVTAIDLLAQLICTVLGDDAVYVDFGETKTTEKTNNEQRGLVIPERSVGWVASSAQKLLLLIQKLTSLDSHSHWRVRLSLARWANRLLIQCKRSLELCVPVLLGVIITLSMDKYPSIGELCRITLDKFSASLDPKDRSLLELLQENFYCTILQLPAIIRRSDDAKKLSILNQLCGYVSIMGPTVNLILNSSAHVEKLSLSLILLTELDCDHFHLVTEQATVPTDALKEAGFLPQSRQRREFRHFRDEQIALQIYELCKGIGKWGNLELMVDHFVDRIHESSLYRKQAILLLNEVILGARPKSVDNPDHRVIFNIISSLCEEYMSSPLWNVKVAHNDDSNSIVDEDSGGFTTVVQIQHISTSEESVSCLNSNAVQVCLLLEGISNCAEVLQEHFNPLLMKVLYNVLEKMGSVSATVSHAAFFCLSRISRSCGHCSVPDLIMANADYLLNSLSIKLRYNPTDAKGPTVFRVTLQYGDHHVLTLAEDIVDEILTMLDTFQNEQLGIYLKVLLTLVVAVCKWFPSPKPQTDESKTSISKTQGNAIIDIQKYILEYHESKKMSENFCDEAEADDCDTENMSANEEEEVATSMEEEPKQDIPVHIRMVVKVLQRCGHLLPTQSTIFSVFVMDIINTAAEVLHDYENELLPLVHKTWPAIVCKMNNQNPAVLRAAFRTLCNLANLCGDFIRQRLTKEIWPKIIEFLEKYSMIGVSSENHRGLRHNSAFPLIVDILSNTGELVKSLALPVVEVDNLASAASFYLSSRQPKEIQEAAITLFTDLSSAYPDLIWLKLNDLHSKEKILSKNAKFSFVELAGCSPDNKEFEKNVSLLFSS